MKTTQLLAVMLAGLLALAGGGARAASAYEIDTDASAALSNLYASTPVARTLGREALEIMIFPKIVKAGFIVGGQGGEGELRERGRTVGYYRSVGASYGLQAGVQTFSYVMFFMTPAALAYLNSSKGWEVGVGPSVVIVDEGVAKSLTTTTGRKDVYAIIFGQTGLMAGLGLQGTKISAIQK